MTLPEWVNWFIWRPVFARMGSLQEVEEYWSIDDLVDAHAILDTKTKADRNAREQ